MLKLDTDLNWTPILRGLHDMIIIPWLVVDILGGGGVEQYEHLMSTKIII